MKSDAKGLGQDARRLREFSAFNKFSDGELARLTAVAHHNSSTTQWPLIQEQTPSDACFILLSGEAGVYVGRDRVALLGPGELIGESVLRSGKLRSATVTTTGPAELLRIDRVDLERLVAEIPALRELLDATAARHEAGAPPPKPKPEYSKLSASVPTALLERFEKAAENAGVGFGAALEDALTQWTGRK